MEILKKKISKNIRSCCIMTVAMLFAWYLFFGYKYQFIYNLGTSMEPSLKDGEWLVVERVKEWTPSRFDVVIVKTGGEKLVKRVIGLEGEYVRVIHGKLYIDDKEFTDPYGNGDIVSYLDSEEENSKRPKEEWLFFNIYQDVGLVPKGYIFVIGDNRNVSWYGIVKVKGVRALVIL